MFAVCVMPIHICKVAHMCECIYVCVCAGMKEETEMEHLPELLSILSIKPGSVT